MIASLTTFEDWKTCITVACGIPLTKDYVDQRLQALQDPSDFGTQKFVEFWGDDHRQRVIGWLEQAKAEL
ncbi:MAG: hypothetical protein AAGH41_04920 [Pseudomonadota bacterium]